MSIRRPIPGGLLRELAREMRRKPTAAERAAWGLLRNRRCLGLKFRRQHIIAGFIVDFYCAEIRVAIELDGPVHEESHQKFRDEERTCTIRNAGIDVIRIRNNDLSETCMKEILTPYVSRDPERRSPSPYQGEGDRG